MFTYQAHERVHPETGVIYLSVFARPWEVPGAKRITFPYLGAAYGHRWFSASEFGPARAVSVRRDEARAYAERDPALFVRAPAPPPLPGARDAARVAVGIAVRACRQAGFHGVAESLIQAAEPLQ